MIGYVDALRVSSNTFYQIGYGVGVDAIYEVHKTWFNSLSGIEIFEQENLISVNSQWAKDGDIG